MNFTREPIVETVITPKEGFKLLVRSSKASGQEEFYVDALEVVTFGKNCFYRSLEKPKSFLVPVADYEILEVREARMVLKATGVERVKIGGGREGAVKASREKEEEEQPALEVEALADQKADKRRERRRYRKKRGKSDETTEAEAETETEEKRLEKPSLIPPPATLISESITRYKEASLEIPQEEEVKEES